MTIHPGRHSAPTLFVVGRAVRASKGELARAWAKWIEGRQAGADTLAHGDLERPCQLILDLFVHMTGPMRHEARETWYSATELYGRLAEARGLSTGEVVDELQHLRELLVVELSDIIVALPARQQLPAVLRINRVLDTAVSNAVVGYTDALVAKMFSRDGVPVPTADSVRELLAQLHGLESDVQLLDERSAG